MGASGSLGRKGGGGGGGEGEEAADTRGGGEGVADARGGGGSETKARRGEGSAVDATDGEGSEIEAVHGDGLAKAGDGGEIVDWDGEEGVEAAVRGGISPVVTESSVDLEGLACRLARRLERVRGLASPEIDS